MAGPVFFVDIGPDGAVSVHPQRLELPALVAPIPQERQASAFNTIREPLVAIGCMRLPHRAFAFDSSFIGPEAENRLTKFASLMTLLKTQDPADDPDFPPISLFGHADPVGNDDYNARLSGRRALAVYGLLTRDTVLWKKLSAGWEGDQWGRRALRTMLSVSLKRLPDGSDEPAFFEGPIDPPTPADKAALERATDDALKAYKVARGSAPPASAVLDGATQERLFREYMDRLCHLDNPERTPFRLDAGKHFIARKGDGAGLKADVQGCGEFNPLLLMSRAEKELFDSKTEFKQARDAVNEPNRRVLAFVFRHGTVVDPKRWPCPRASDGFSATNLNACIDRFWSDHADRLRNGEDRRRFGEQMALAEPDDDGNFEVDDAGHAVLRDIAETGHTMACRFYHGFAAYSPCEAGAREWVVRFRVDALATNPDGDGGFVPLRGKRYALQMGEGGQAAVVRGRLDGNGELRIPVVDRRVRMSLRLDALASLLPDDDPNAVPPNPDRLVDGRFPGEDDFMLIELDAGLLKKLGSEGDVEDLATRQRLYNLGFGPPDPAKWDVERDLKPAARAYRTARKLPPEAKVRDEVQREHDLEDATPVPPDEDQTPT
jgi:hypothetical protein